MSDTCTLHGYLDDALGNKDGTQKKKRLWWGCGVQIKEILFPDEAGVVSWSPGAFVRMMTEIVVVCQDFGVKSRTE